MPNIGTLWFGSDIDLNGLKQKIQEGNKSILNALKMKYDEKSYQEMVGQLRSNLQKEQFSINVTANTKNVRQSIQESLSGVGGGNVGINLKGLKGVNAIKSAIYDQEDIVKDVTRDVERLKEAYKEAAKYGSSTTAAKNAAAEHTAAKNALSEEETKLFALNQQKKRATLAQSVLNEKMRQGSAAARQYSSDSLRLNATLAGGIHVSTRLGSALSALFAVHAAREFLSNVIEIGGQLERQRISIGAILGDVAHANILFEQIKNLAVKSPFGVVELDQYTKQLSAYGFQYSELFDMTKRLADIAAGAGTDIGRLTLALGHVRSATYLTGITLRQFSMNNIPMLKMLADYYSEVEKRAISTAEVQKRISKREVSYEDVIEQIRRLTDEGGMFYNMQEKISESLSAKFKNLKDSFDIMYGEMAESSLGDALKSLATTLTALSRSWKEVGALLTGGVAAFIGYRMAVAVANDQLVLFRAQNMQAALAEGRLTAIQLDELAVSGRLTKEMLLQAVAKGQVEAKTAELAATTYGVSRAQLDLIASTGRVRSAMLAGGLATSQFTINQLRFIAEMRASGAAMNSVSMKWQIGLFKMKNAAVGAFRAIGAAWKSVAIFAGIEALISAFMYFSEKSEEAEERIKSLQDTANEGAKNISESTLKFGVGLSKSKTEGELKNMLGDMVEVIKNYSPLKGAALAEAFKIDSETGKSVHTVAEQYELLAKEIRDTKEAYEELSNVSTIFEQANDDTGNIFTLDDKFIDNITDYSDALKERQKAENDLLQNRAELVRNLAEIRKAYPEFTEDMQGRGIGTNDIVAQIQLLEQYKNTWRGVYEQNAEQGLRQRSIWESFYAMMRDTEGWTAWADAAANVDVAYKKMLKDGQRFAEGLTNRLKGAWGDDVNAWTDAQKRTVQIGLRSYMDAIEGYKDMSKQAREDIERRILAPMNITLDADVEDAYKSVSGFESYLESVTTRDWTVKVTGEVSTTWENVKKSQKDLNSNIPAYEKAFNNNKAYEVERLKELGRLAYEAGIKNDAAAAKKAEEAISNYIDSRVSTDDTQKKMAHELVQFYKEAENNKAFENATGLPLVDEKKTTKTADEELKAWKNELKELKAFWSEYEKYLKYMTSDEAVKAIQDKGLFPSLFANGGLGFDVRGGIGGALMQLMSKTNGATAERQSFQIDLRKAMSDVELKGKEEFAKNAISQLDETLAEEGKRWDLYKKILEVTGDSSKASQIAFSSQIGFKNFAEQLRSSIEGALQSMPGAEGVSVDELLGMDNKSLKELGIFENASNGIYQKLKLLKEEMAKVKSEEVDILIDAIKNAQSLDTELAKIANKYAKVRDAINNDNTLSGTQKNTLLGNATANEEREKADVRWKYFKETDEWTKSFGNLERVSTATLGGMLSQLQSLAPKINMSVEATRALGNAIEKIRNMQNSRNPFTAISGSMERISALRSLSAKLKKGKYSLYGLTDEESKKTGISTGVKSAEKLQSEIGDGLRDAETELTKGIKGVADKFSAIQGVLSPVIDLFDTLGNETLGDIFGAGSNALGAASSVASGLNSLGLGSIGVYGAAAGAGLSVISSIFSLHDKALQKEIEASEQRQKEMEYLTDNLTSAIERSLSGIYGLKAESTDMQKLYDAVYETVTVVKRNEKRQIVSSERVTRRKSYVSAQTEADYKKAEETQKNYDMQRAALSAQRDELQHQIEVEKDKKKSDADAIADKEQELAELEEQYKNFALDMAKTLYEIDVKSWAQEFGDALYEAWKKGESGAEAFRQKASEIIGDLTKNILVQKVIGEALKPLEDYIVKTMDETSGELDPIAFAQGLATLLDGVLGNVVPTVDAVYDAVDKALVSKGYTSLKESGSSSGMTNSIQSNTEQTGDILASYVNGIRADAAVNRSLFIMYLPKYEEIMQRSNNLLETQLAVQQQIAENTSRNAIAAEEIHELLRQARMDKNYGFYMQ